MSKNFKKRGYLSDTASIKYRVWRQSISKAGLSSRYVGEAEHD